MEDQPHAPPSCINDIFPAEIMQYICQRLESKDLLKSMKVCKFWEDVILHHNEVDLHVGQRNRRIWKDYDGPPFQPIQAMTKFRTRRVFISKLENPKEELPPIQTEFWRKPDLLRYLWIDGYMRKATFNNMLIGLTNLEKLELHYNILTSFDPSDTSVLIFNSLVNLKNFSIRIFSREQNTYKHRENGFVNIIGIFISEVKFPQLESINLCLPSRPVHDVHFVQLLQSITYFMIQHKLTLKNFKLFIGNWAGSGEVFQLPSGTHIPQLTGKDLQVLKMESIEIHAIPYLNDVPPFFDWMLEFVNGQRQIEVIHLTVEYLSVEQIQQSVPNYENTIKVIQLAVDTMTTPLDLDMFSTCIHLKRLELNGYGRGDGIVDYEYGKRIQTEDVDLIGGRLIPKTLESLILLHLYISNQDISEILQDQVHLKSLRCVYVGVVMNIGVSFDTFIRLVSERHVEKMFFRNSINSKNVNVKDVQPNEIGGLNIQSLLSHKNKKKETEFSLRLMDGLNYIQIEEDDECQVYPDGQNYPHFVIHEDNDNTTDEFHETPYSINYGFYACPSELGSDD